ncbi:MAG: GNAT family N-acetyltransferase [Chloroflexi bacterium]|jgi:ribosomal protein S18 acetylase RimI-like enzyme|nr:GNAT family N-acetyltransferase [Anaerolineaceae bacterium]NMB87655.1 GNAT family N-acetyltransferase [Chloroflexota bacterium]
MPAEIVFLNTTQVEEIQQQVFSVYQAAFGELPYLRTHIDTMNFALSLSRHMQRDGFRFAAVFSGREHSLAGFAYGYTSRPGQWWHDTVAAVLPSNVARTWLDGSFELAELALHPASQGVGLGSRLHDTLLEGLPHRRAVLSTLRTETTAMHLYRRRGWVVLMENLEFPGSGRVYRIMGLSLKD